MQKSMYLFALFLLFSCQGEPTAEQEADASSTNLPSLGQAGAPTNAAKGKNPTTDDQAQSDVVGYEPSSQNPSFGEETRIKMYNGILEGSWESLTETFITIKFEEGKMKRYKGTDPESEEDYKLDFGCADNACKSVSNPYGMCIVTASNCFTIMKIDQKNLQFTSASDQTSHRLVKVIE